MKIDFRTKLTSLTGEPLEVEKRVNDKIELVPMTLGFACSNALLTMLDQKDMAQDGPTKYRWNQLAGKVMNTKDVVTVTAEEITLMKKRVGKKFGPTVVGPVFDLLEGRNVPKTNKVNDSEAQS